MGEQAKIWLVEQLERKQISVEVAAAVLEVPLEDICVGTGRMLDSDDFMRICSHYHLRPAYTTMKEAFSFSCGKFLRNSFWFLKFLGSAAI